MYVPPLSDDDVELLTLVELLIKAVGDRAAGYAKRRGGSFLQSFLQKVGHKLQLVVPAGHYAI